MESDLVKDFRKSCSVFDDELHEYYDNVAERGADGEDLDYLIGLMNELLSLQTVRSKDKVRTGNLVLNSVKERFYARKAHIDTYLAREEEERQRLANQDEEIYEAKPHKCHNGAWFAGGVAVGLVFGSLLGNAYGEKTAAANKALLDGAADAQYQESDVDNDLDSTLTTDNTTNNETDDKANVQTDTTNTNLKLGEYGTFTDVTDYDQVQARAQYIIDNYFDDMTKNIDAGDRHLITVENVANVIRVMNGELPLDENGYVDFDGNSLDDLTNVLVAMTVDSGSSKGQDYYHFPAYLLTVDGSDVSEFIKSYDVIYDKLAYSLTVHDDEQAQDAIACLGFKFWKEWYLQGMYGDVNPHTFESQEKYLAFIATVEPFNTTGKEWHLSMKQPVCIEACIDYETQKLTAIPVNDIHAALETGAWNKVGAQRLAGMDVPNDPWLPLFRELLNDQLNWKYDHLDTMKLKK